MAAMRLAFERRGRLDEKDFTAEMLHALHAQDLEWDQQVCGVLRPRFYKMQDADLYFFQG